MGCGSSKDTYSIGYDTERKPRAELTWIATSDTSNLCGQPDSCVEWGSTLGRGKYGNVKLAQGQSDKLFYAVKCIPKALIYERKAAPQTQAEIETLGALAGSHPFICHCFHVWQDDEHVCLCTEFAFGGELYQRMQRQRLNESAAKFYAAEICIALSFLHETHLLLYRDLKPENILIDHEGHVKLIDFGFAHWLRDEHEQLENRCGTAMYLAPEIAGGKTGHGLAVDFWSLGCVIYEMVVGKCPFGDTSGSSKFEVFNRINSGKVRFPTRISNDAKSLIQSLLKVDPTQRATWVQLRAHKWFAEVDWDAFERREAVPPWVPPCTGDAGEHSHFLKWKDVPKNPPPSDAQAKSYCTMSIPARLQLRPARRDSLGNIALVANGVLKAKRKFKAQRSKRASDAGLSLPSTPTAKVAPSNGEGTNGPSRRPQPRSVAPNASSGGAPHGSGQETCSEGESISFGAAVTAARLVHKHKKRKKAQAQAEANRGRGGGGTRVQGQLKQR